MNDLAGGWTCISEQVGGDLVLAVDFDAAVRREATFRDLARRLPDMEIWHAVPPDQPAAGQPRHYLDRWLELPRAGRVGAVFGYCAGSVFASALAEDLEQRQGSRPEVILFNPGPPSVATLDRDFRGVVGSMEALSSAERADVLGRADSVLARCGDDFDAVSAEYAALYRQACLVVFQRMGIDGDVGDELTDLFRSYVSYLAAARQLQREPLLAPGTSITAREHRGAVCTQEEVTFDLARGDLLRSRAVATTVSELITVKA